MLVQEHQEKIQQLNRIITRVWKETYQNDDIKTIKIKSEIDVAKEKDKQ